MSLSEETWGLSEETWGLTGAWGSDMGLGEVIRGIREVTLGF